MKSSGERYKQLRESGKSLEGTATDERTSHLRLATQKPLHEAPIVDHTDKINLLLEGTGAFDPMTQTQDDLQGYQRYWTKNGRSAERNWNIFLYANKPNDEKRV